MDRRRLKGTDLDVSRVCLGTMTFGAQASEDEALRILQSAFDGGINFIDTANVYVQGESEKLLGKFLQGRREQVVLATKVGMKVGEEQPGLSRQAITAGVENSLRRLQTDYLDIYYLHAPDYSVPVEESLGAIDSLVRAGKVRWGATSNYASWQLCRMHWIAAEQGYRPARIAQPMYNLIARRIEDEFLPACAELEVSTVVYNPLAGGLLTGKQQKSAPQPGTRFDNNKMYLDRYWNDAAFDAISQLTAAADKENRSLISMSLNWLLHHTATDCIILGASSSQQLESNLRALNEGPLTSETLAVCDSVWQTLRGAAPKYNR
jgi:aryl-alcohol dehydrogenase-like predicted oxidoreductase